MTISEAVEALVVAETTNELRKTWPHVIQPRLSENAFELMAWLSENVTRECIVEWAEGVPIVGMRDPDEAFAMRMRWA